MCCLLLRGCGLQQAAVLDSPPRIVDQGLPLEHASRQLRGNLAKACNRTMQTGRQARRRASASCLDLVLLLLCEDCLLLRAPWLFNLASVWPALPVSCRNICSGPAPPQRTEKQPQCYCVLHSGCCCAHAAVSCYCCLVHICNITACALAESSAIVLQAVPAVCLRLVCNVAPL